MKKLVILFAFAGFLLTAHAYAGKVPISFGQSEDLHTIQKLDTKGPNGESYFLDYKTASFSILFPLYVVDQGYVLTKSDDPIGTYYTLSDDLIKKNQEQGFFPDPMPTYSIGLFDYLYGFSFWIFALLIGLKIYAAVKSSEKSPNKTMDTQNRPDLV